MHQNKAGEPNSLEKQFKDLSKGKQQIDFKKIDGLQATGYSSALKQSTTLLTTVLKEGNPESKNVAMEAVRLMPKVIQARVKSTNDWVKRGGIPDSGHANTLRNWRENFKDVSRIVREQSKVTPRPSLQAPPLPRSNSSPQMPSNQGSQPQTDKTSSSRVAEKAGGTKVTTTSISTPTGNRSGSDGLRRNIGS